MPRTKSSKVEEDDEIELSPSPPRQSSRKKEHHRHHQQSHRHEHHSHHHTSSNSSSSVSKRDHHTHHSSTKKSSTSTSSEKLSLSVDETNKLRAKLGLKPLETTTTTTIDEKKNNGGESGTKIKDDWGEFIHKPATNLSDRKQTEKLKEKLANRKNKRRLDEKYANVKTLGESSSDEDVTDKKSGSSSVARWVSKTKEKEEKAKLLAKKRSLIYDEYENDVLDEVAESEAVLKKKAKRDEELQRRYNEASLKGLKIEHSASDFETGSITILHLKDSNILDADESGANASSGDGQSAGADVLVNTNLMQNESYRQSNENKKFRFGLRPSYQLAEEEENGEVSGKNILSKYDEEIGLKSKASFVIGMDVNGMGGGRDEKKTTNSGFNLNVDEDQTTSRNRLASDYYTEEEMSVRFKKTSSKKKDKKRNKPEKKLRKTQVYDDDDDDGPIVDEHQNVLDEIDDEFDSIGEQLNRIRRMQQQREVLNVRQELKIEPQFDEPDTMDTSDTNRSHMVLDTVAEFCRTLGDIPTYGRAGNRETNDSELLDFEKEKEAVENSTTKHDKGKRGWNKIDENSDQTNGSVPSSTLAKAPILDEEPTIGTGVAAALKLAMTKGYLEKETTKKTASSRFKYLEAKNYSIEDKNHGGQDDFGGGSRGGYHGGGGGGNRRERYSDFKEKEIKPTFKLDYRDDEGKVLNAKEAFRHLSHKFHGKGPGRNKIEKRLRKKEQERLMTKMSSTDTPLGTLNLLRHKQKESKMPYVVLAGGSQSIATGSKQLTSNVKP